MRQLRLRLRESATALGVPQDVVEKDYAISYVLAALSVHERLRHTLVLKGGTALKKLHFGDYRFSEDLDFSAQDAPTGDDLAACLSQATASAEITMGEQGAFQLQVERYLERDPHPHGQEAFTVRIRFPWHREALCRVKIEIANDEPILLTPASRPIIHGYDEPLDCSANCYTLEEIVAEKLRTLLQTHQKLARRGWIRPRARDYYDLWRVLSEYRGELTLALIPDLLARKAAHRQVSWSAPSDFFTNELISEARRTWRTSLGPFVADLPDCDTVLVGLQATLSQVLSKT